MLAPGAPSGKNAYVASLAARDGWVRFGPLAARRSRLAWPVLALAAEAAIAGADIATAHLNVLASALLVPPLVLATVAGSAPTAVAAVFAVALAAASGGWDHNAGTHDWSLRLLLVGTAGGAAVIFAVGRTRLALANLRLRLLAGLSDAADGTLALDDALSRMSDLIVPALADICGWGVSERGRPRRVAMRIEGADRDEERVLEELSPADPARIAEPRLYTRVTDEDLLDISGPERGPILSSYGLRSVMTVPLVARGRHLGALYLGVGRSGRHYGPGELEYATLVASRAALALDNAGLFAEVAQLERERAAVLATLPDAVTVQDQRGRVVYANEAAARLLGAASPEEVVRAQPGEITARFEIRDEAGDPVAIEALPARRVLAGESDPEPLVVYSVDLDTGVGRWQLIKATGLSDAAGRVTHAVNVMEDITDAKRAERAQRLLAEAGAVLASSLDYEHTLEQVARIAIPELADWCSIDILSDGGLQRVAAAHRDPVKVAVAWELDRRYPIPLTEHGGLAGVIRSGRPLLLEHVEDAGLARFARDDEHLALLREIGFNALMAVPLTVGGRPFGLLTFVAVDARRTFDTEDLALAEELGRRAAMAVENARAYRVRAAIAATLQSSLLPGDLPLIQGWRAAALYRAAGEANDVGGDLYDAFEVPGGWLLVIGDVTGKGAPAAALTALVRYAIRALGDIVAEPSGLLQRVNKLLLERSELSLVTAACVRLDGGREATFAVAGHPAPLLVRAGSIEPVEATGALLGAFPDQVAQDVRVAVEPGEGIVLYTDGVLDAWGGGERFGEERLIATLRGAERSPEGVIAAVAAALDAFQEGPQRDDTAVLAVFRDA